jgi:hypothetical protein
LDLRTTRTIRSAIEIRAPIETVWGVLTDFAAYPDWNPHIRRVLGTVAQGSRLAIHTRPPGGRTIVMRPRVTKWAPPTELRWRATFLNGRLFAGEHGFRLEPTGASRVRFVQDETFSGLLVPLYARLRLPRTRRGFDEVNQALRSRVEQQTGSAEQPAAEGETATREQTLAQDVDR